MGYKSLVLFSVAVTRLVKLRSVLEFLPSFICSELTSAKTKILSTYCWVGILVDIVFLKHNS